MEKLLLIMLMTASVSFTISFTGIFSGFREWVSKIHPKLEELIFCPYCLSHYIALLILLICQDYYPFTGTNKWLDIIMTIFSIVGGSSLCHYVMLRAYEPVAKNMLFRKMNQKK